MPEIIPRWEWRAFGTDFGAAEAKFAAMTAEKVQESDEFYLLSPGTDANVKIRDALMDLKTLEQVGPGGLEQWRPVMKATFPLTPAAVLSVCTALGVPAPTPSRETTSLEQLRSALAAHAVRTVPVHKRRVRYTIGGCMSELTEVVADGRSVRTAAIESEDAERVLAAVRDMGLGGLANTSYPRGLKALLGMRDAGA